MIKQGCNGSLNLYFKDILISSFPLTNKKTFQHYFNQGEYLIKKSKGIPIRIQIKTYLEFCNLIKIRKKNHEAIYKTDHIMFLNCLAALMRLKIINDDDSNGILVCPRKK